MKAKLFNLSAPWTLFLLWSLGECKDLPGRKVQSITLFIIKEEAPYPKGVLKHHLQPSCVWLADPGGNLQQLGKEESDGVKTRNPQNEELCVTPLIPDVLIRVR